MNLEVLSYLKKYIKDRYPMYYDPDKDTEFLSFINIIASDNKFKSELDFKSVNSTKKEVLEEGELDAVIDDLVSRYGQIRYTKIWANIGSLSSYIKDVIIKDNQKKSDEDNVNADTLDRICKEIALSIIKNEETDDYSYYMDGVFDQKFIEDYHYHLNEYKKDVKNRVDLVIQEKIKHCRFKVTEDTYLLIINNISDVMMRDFKYVSVKSGDCDKNILIAFNIFRKRLTEEITNYVNNYINNEIDDLLGVPVSDVVDYILLVTIYKGEISVDKLLEGRMDDIIKGTVAVNRKEKATNKDAINHINSIVIDKSSASISNEEVFEIANQLYTQLRSMNIFDHDIVSKKYDEQIVQLYEAMMRENLSVKNGKGSQKRKLIWGKKTINKHILPLIIVGTVTISAGVMAYKIGDYLVEKGKGIVQDIKNQKPLRKVDEFDNYQYMPIHTKYTDGYGSMKQNIIKFYQNASVYNDENYKYLGFYRAYDYVYADKLAIMDSMISDLKVYSKDKEELVDFYNSISDCSCYLDFVVLRLEEMGCEEIKDDKYVKAVGVYRNAMMAAHDNLTPMDILTADFSKHADVVSEIMQMYREYSENYLIDFGNVLMDDSELQKNSGRII